MRTYKYYTQYTYRYVPIQTYTTHTRCMLIYIHYTVYMHVSIDVSRIRNTQCTHIAHIVLTYVQSTMYNVCCIMYIIYQIYINSQFILCNILLQNEEVCGNAIYSSSEASGVNHIIHYE